MSKEEIEIFHFENLQTDDNAKQLYSILQTASEDNCKVSVTINKTKDFKFQVQEKKNAFFAKQRKTLVSSESKKFNSFSNHKKGKLPLNTASQFEIPQETPNEEDEANQVEENAQMKISQLKLPEIQTSKETRETSIQDNLKTCSSQRINKGRKTTDLNLSDQKYSQLSRRSGLKFTIKKTTTQNLFFTQREEDGEHFNILQEQKKDHKTLIAESFHYQKLQESIQFFQEGHFYQVKKQLTQIYKETFQKVIRNSQNKQQLQVWSLVCIQCLCYLNQVYRALAKYSKANMCLEQCKNRFEIVDPDILAKIELEIAQNYLCNMQILNSIQHYEKALIIYEMLNWKSDIAYTLSKMSRALAILEKGEKDYAKKVSYEALAIAKQKLLDTDARLTYIFHNVGEAFFYSKDYEQSLFCLQQSLERKQKRYLLSFNTAIHKSFGDTLNLIGMNHHLKEQISQSICYYKKALECVGGEVTLSRGQILNNLALAQVESLLFKSALNNFNEAVNIYKGFYLDDDPKMIKLLKNRTLVYSMISEMMKKQ